MLLTIVFILIALWLLGVVIHVGAGFIHLLLVVALIVFIYDLLTKNRRV